MQNFILHELAQSEAVVAAMQADTALRSSICAVGVCLVGCFRAGGKVLLAGNGGSAADAQHIAAEFVSRLKFDREALPSIALTTDSSILTAIGNDYGFEKLFERQVSAHGRPGDVFVGITTSGRSPNVLRGFSKARAMGLRTIGLCGAQGIQEPGLCDIEIRVPSTETTKIQEGHIVVAHILCGIVENALFSRA